MSAARLLSIQVGRPRCYDEPPRFVDRPAPWWSGFEKQLVDAAVWLGALNLEGDGQGDRNAHGGRDKAVNVYPAEHYDHWITAGVVDQFRPGAFGENFSLCGLLEQDVCIGDVFRIGDALLQVSQPRQPCWKLAHFLAQRDLVRQVIDSGRTGWYFRVLEPGRVQAGAGVELQDRPHGDWDLARANQVMHRAGDRAQEERLWTCPALSESWRRTLGRRLGRA